MQDQYPQWPGSQALSCPLGESVDNTLLIFCIVFLSLSSFCFCICWVFRIRGWTETVNFDLSFFGHFIFSPHKVSPEVTDQFIWSPTYDARQVNQLLLVARVVGVSGIAKSYHLPDRVFP